MKAKKPADSSLKPESQMMRYGYDPELASHAVKPPMYLTSTFSFTSAEHGKAYAEVINGLRTQRPDEDFSNTYIYGRTPIPISRFLSAAWQSGKTPKQAQRSRAGWPPLRSRFWRS